MLIETIDNLNYEVENMRWKTLTIALCTVFLLSGCENSATSAITSSAPAEYNDDGSLTKYSVKKMICGRWKERSYDPEGNVESESETVCHAYYEDGVFSIYSCSDDPWNGHAYNYSINDDGSIQNGQITSYLFKNDNEYGEYVERLVDDENGGLYDRGIYWKYLGPTDGPEPKVNPYDSSTEVEIGMDSKNVKRILGRPDDINKTTTSSHVHEQWVYRSRGMYVYIDDGTVISIQE